MEGREEVPLVEMGEDSLVERHAGLRPVGVRVFKGAFRRPNIMACLPSADGRIPLEVHLSLLQLASPLNGTVDYYCLKGIEIGMARNMFIERARTVAQKPDYVMFIGDDMLPPWWGMIKLWEEAERGGWDVLGGCYGWKSDPVVPLVWSDSAVGYPNPKTWQEDEVVPCDVCGMDFTLVRLSVIDKLGVPPWFKTVATQDPEDGGVFRMTEDSFFCRRVRSAGGRVAVHTGVRVGHLDFGTGRIYEVT